MPVSRVVYKGGKQIAKKRSERADALDPDIRYCSVMLFANIHRLITQ